MSFKTILVPVEQHDLMNATLETALVLARKFDAYIEGFALRPVVAPVMAMDIGGAFRSRSCRKTTPRWRPRRRRCTTPSCISTTSHAAIPTARSAALARRCAGRRSVCRQSRPRVRRHGAGPARRERASPRLSTYEACLFESGRPILLAPPTPPRKWARTS